MTNTAPEAATSSNARKILTEAVEGAKRDVAWQEEQLAAARADLTQAEAAVAELDALEQAR